MSLQRYNENEEEGGVLDWTLYHGSQQTIPTPLFGVGNRFNDYGLGFYCTESLNLAKEWACLPDRDGVANCYLLHMDGLSVLNLLDGRYNILNWLSILLENRKFDVNAPIAAQGKEYLLKSFLPEYQSFDIIIGYRADDSYFSFASAFLHNTISLRQLERAMFLGELGEQIVLKSEQAFARLRFQEGIPAERSKFFKKKMERDSSARAAFRAYRQEMPTEDDIFLLDILREGWNDDDPRLRRRLPG